MRWVGALVALVLVSSLAACGDRAAGREALEVVAPTGIVPGDPVPAPARPGDAALTVTGGIERPNDGGALVLDLSTLEQVGLVAFELHEPFLDRRVGFQGVALADVLALAGVAPGVTEVASVALNEYSVTIPLGTATDPRVLVATRDAAGDPIPVADGGPIRIVLLDGAPGSSVRNYWIWSLVEMELR